MSHQSAINKKGEIEFRRNLVKKQVEGKLVLENEYDREDIERILKERMEKTLHQMEQLRSKGVFLSPYIEIGAERCQRSLVIEDALGCSGAAVDISFDMLRSCEYYRRVFNLSSRPTRICCDAYRLPFISGSVPFIFCYETLHHFPEPSPIVKEIYRVLSPGGFFFFDEEPYKKRLHVNLYKRKGHIEELGTRNNLAIRIIRHLFCQPVPNELEFGIIENQEISLRTWKQALADFDVIELRLTSSLNNTVKLDEQRHLLRYIFAYLNGGIVSGLCQKRGLYENTGRIEEILICPECMKNSNESILHYEEYRISCDKCGREYSIIDGVLFLLAADDMKILYPEYSID